MRNFIMKFARLNPSLRAALAAWALVSFAYFGILTVLQNLYLLRLGFGIQFIGLLTGMNQFVWAVLALPAAMLARRMGTRNALIYAYVEAPTVYMLFLLVEGLPRDWWQAWLIGCQVLLGVGFALTSTSIFPYLMGMASEDERLHTFAAQRGVTAVATLVGSLVAGFLPVWLAGLIGPGDAAAPYRYVLWFVVLAEYMAALIMLSAKAAPVVSAPAPGSADARPVLNLFLGIGAIAVLMAFGEGSVQSFFNVFMDRRLGADTAQIGSVVGITALAGVAVAFGAPPLMARLGVGRSIAFGAIGVVLGLVLLASAPQWQVAGIGYAIVMGIGALNATARNLFGQELAPVHMRTTMAAILSIGSSAGAVCAAVAGGYLIGSFGFSSFFLIAGAVSTLAAPLALNVTARHAPREAAATTT